MVADKVLVFFVALCVSWLFAARLKKNATPISAESIFLVFYFFFGVVGGTLLYLEVDPRRLDGGLANQDALTFVWGGAIAAGVISIVICTALKSHFFFGVSPFSRNKVIPNFPPRMHLLVVTLVLVLFTGIYWVVYDSPLKIMFQGGGVAEAFSARQTGQEEVGFLKVSHIKFVTHECQMLWALYLLANYILFRSKYSLLLGVVASVSLILVMVSNLSKGGVIFFFGGVALLLAFNRGWTLSLSKVVLGVGGLLLIATFLQFIFLPNSGDINFFNIYVAVWSRVTSGQIEPAYYVYSFVNDNDMLLGQTFPNPKSIFPFQHFDLEEKAWALMNPSRVAQGLSYKNPTSFWVEGFANFGWFGVAVFSTIVGVLLFVLDYMFLRRERLSAFSLALLLYLSLHYARLSGKAFSTFLWDLDVVVVLLFFFAVKFFFGIRVRWSSAKLG